MLYSSVSAIRLKTFSPNSQMQFSKLQRQEPVIILSGLLTPFKSCSQTSAEVLSRFSQHSLTIPRFFSALPLGDLSYSSVPLSTLHPCLPSSKAQVTIFIEVTPQSFASTCVLFLSKEENKGSN